MSRRILVVDDSSLARRRARNILEGGGYEVIEAGSADTQPNTRHMTAHTLQAGGRPFEPGTAHSYEYAPQAEQRQ